MSAWPQTRRRRWLLGAIVVLGTALRLWLWWRTPIHQPANDEVEYLQVARDLLAGRGWQFYDRYHWLRAPLYPLWLAFSLWLARGDLALAALPNLALSSATIPLFYLLGREVGCTNLGAPDRGDRALISVQTAERAGLLAAVFAAVLLTLATFASLWMAETLFTALFAAALLALLRWARQPRFSVAALAGALLGLAILTRSLPLTALPFAALWMLAQRASRVRSWRVSVQRHAIAGTLVFVAGALLVIAPWSARNYAAYGAFIPVETGLSYNLWAFNEPREDSATIFRTLESIPNPADRADYATAKGVARLREDPAILARKLEPNWTALWRVKPIQDRFVQRTYYEDVPLGMFALALLLDDALLYVLVGAGGLGLIAAPLDRRKALLGGWLLYVIATVLLTHGEGRYRHFVFPVVLPYAALMFAQRQAVARWFRRKPWRLIALPIIVGLLWIPIVQQYPLAWAARNVERGWLVQRAQWAVNRGDRAAADALYARAAQVDPQSADVWLERGVMLQNVRADAEALAAFETAFAREPSYIPTNIRRGDALRRAGRIEEAREVLRGFYTDPVAMLDWAWANLQTPAPSAIDVGDGLDFGFVGGMYAPEAAGSRMARWTRGDAAMRLQGSAAPTTLRLTVSAPRPDAAPVPLRICVNDRCEVVQLSVQWRTMAINVPAAPHYAITLRAPTFVPQAFVPQSTDDRKLGVLVDFARVGADGPD